MLQHVESIAKPKIPKEKTKEYQRRYYEKHPEALDKQREYQREYKKRPEVVAKQREKYQSNHKKPIPLLETIDKKEKQRQNSASYYWEHREEILEKNKVKSDLIKRLKPIRPKRKYDKTGKERIELSQNSRKNLNEKYRQIEEMEKRVSQENSRALYWLDTETLHHEYLYRSIETNTVIGSINENIDGTFTAFYRNHKFDIAPSQKLTSLKECKTWLVSQETTPTLTFRPRGLKYKKRKTTTLKEKQCVRCEDYYTGLSKFCSDICREMYKILKSL